MYNINRLVGIEMECSEEDKNDTLPKGLFWRKSEDESVDYFGAEYKFIRPLHGNDVVESVDQLVEHMHFMNAKVKNVDAGFHLHLNFGNQTPDDAINFIDAVSGLYPILLQHVSKERHNNQYCARYRTKITGTDTKFKPSQYIKHCWPGIDSSRLFMWDRYYWIHPYNMAGHKKTVEIRLHHSTKKRDKILTWVELWSQLADSFQQNKFTEINSQEEFNNLLSNMEISDKTRERFYV